MKIKSMLKDKKVIALILFFLVFYIFVSIFVIKMKNSSYPLVFKNEKNELIYLSDSKKIDSSKILTSNGNIDSISYLKNGKYTLYTNSSNELFIVTKNNNNTLIASNIISKLVTENENYIILLSGDRNLKIHDVKVNKSFVLDKDVDNILTNNNNKVIYAKKGTLYISDLKNNKNIKKITSDFDSQNIGQTIIKGQHFYLISQGSNLEEYGLRSLKSKVIDKNVKRYYCDKNCNNIFIEKNNGELAFYNGKKSTTVDDGVMDVLGDMNNNTITYKKNDGFYYAYKNSKTLIEKNSEFIYKAYINDDNSIYYLNNNSLIYLKYSNNKIVQNTTLKDVYPNTINKIKGGFAFISSNQELCILKDDKIKIVDKDALMDDFIVGRNGKSIYYLKMNENNKELYVYDGKNNKLIDSNIYDFTYVNENCIYFLKNYKPISQKHELYKYTNKSKKILDDVVELSDIKYEYE